MKKFTLVLIATVMAVTAWAGTPVGNATLTTSARRTAPSQQKAVLSKDFTSLAMDLNTGKRHNVQALPSVRKAPRKVSLDDALSGDLMLVSAYFQYDYDSGYLVDSEPYCGGTPITITKVAGSDDQYTINHFTSDATEPIQATITPIDDDWEVIAKVSIPDGQLLLTTDYGPVYLINAEAEGEPIVGYFDHDGLLDFNNYWLDRIGGEGIYAGFMWSGFYYLSSIAPVNGVMTWGEKSAKVFIAQEPFHYETISVYNFGDLETAINVTVSEDKTFVIEQQMVYDGGPRGVFKVVGLNEDPVGIIPLTGVGTEATLTFDCHWTFYSEEGYWHGLLDPATITLTDGSTFVYGATSVGIAEVTGDQQTMCFDLQGRRVSDSHKGLILMQVRQQDGTVQTQKVVRK